MTTKVTNGEFYDYELKTWMVRCGPTAVPIQKRDTNGQPVPPPERVAKVSNSE